MSIASRLHVGRRISTGTTSSLTQVRPGFTSFLKPYRRLSMNKGELVDKIAAKASVTKKQADAVLTAAIETIMEAVSDGDKVTLVGFGSFESRDRKAREGRNPKTGDKMEIPATKVPAFSAGKLFKDKVAPPED
jgi:DNA-binding protein HU-beta